MVQRSVRSEWQNDLNLSIEKIARMKDISIRRGAQGILTVVTLVCGMFLFSVLSADVMEETTITIVGATGYIASLGVFISELYANLKAQKRIIEKAKSSQFEREQAAAQEEPVEEEPVEEVRRRKGKNTHTKDLISNQLSRSALGYLSVYAS